MFVHKTDSGTCLLNEQSRMDESICDVVGNVFYDGRLIVAEDCEASPIWRAERVVRFVRKPASLSWHPLVICRIGGYKGSQM